ncbi:hypothetical protein LEMLEM_LOCUS7815 [Lemmus lemmus]
MEGRLPASSVGWKGDSQHPVWNGREVASIQCGMEGRLTASSVGWKGGSQHPVWNGSCLQTDLGNHLPGRDILQEVWHINGLS